MKRKIKADIRKNGIGFYIIFCHIWNFIIEKYKIKYKIWNC